MAETVDSIIVERDGIRVELEFETGIITSSILSVDVQREQMLGIPGPIERLGKPCDRSGG